MPIPDLSTYANSIPGDCRLLESKDLYTNEASLTGETFPVEKKCCIVSPNAALSERDNTLFMGTHVISGTARAVVVHTGLQTEFGAISKRLRRLQPDTEFERGIRKLGYLLMEVTLLLVLVIFCINVLAFRDRETAVRHRESREHERVLHRQDGDRHYRPDRSL